MARGYGDSLGSQDFQKRYKISPLHRLAVMSNVDGCSSIIDNPLVSLSVGLREILKAACNQATTGTTMGSHLYHVIEHNILTL